jgi:hypothetical protein
MELKLWESEETIKTPDGTIPFKFSAKATLETALSQVRPSGYTLGEMRERMMMLDMLETLPGDGVLVLTDAQKKFLLDSLNATKWRVASENIVKLADLLA